MNGRHLSFADIVRKYQQPLYWYLRRVVFVHEDAEDILQETFMKAYSHFWQLRSEESLKPWLFKIATNEMNRYFRKRRTAESPELLSELLLAEVSEQQPHGDTTRAASRVISSAMLRMSPLQRQVFCMRYYEELDYEQMARITGKTRNTLMVSYHEARQKIEKEIENE